MAGTRGPITSLDAFAGDFLLPGERVAITFPFTHTPPRPRGPEGKVRDGIYQSARRYRPLVLTDRRLLVFDAGRTPQPKLLLAAFPRADLELVSVVPGRFGATTVTLELPG